MLRSKGVREIEKIRIDLDTEGRDALEEKTGRRTVPQVFIGEFHAGGFDDLVALEQAGRLDPLLNGGKA